MENINSDKKHNLLIFEKSPYLLQHAYNPVNWHPWSEEAFAKAKHESKPIFLSIGYSTCHWCHVMEKESFEDQEVAAVLNRYFICIKVDREERPDIDQIYMTFAQMSRGQGGWPLNVFLTSDQKPFYSGTYFPKYSRNGKMGLLDVLRGIASQWEDKRSELTNSAQRITRLLNEMETTHKRTEMSDTAMRDAYNYYRENFDPDYGGFNKAPKFPSPHVLLFLMRFYRVTREKEALTMVEKTLEQMYKGGIFDHVGYGFSRYSTDSKWLVPHFEKMLYDNALMIMVYTECYQITGKSLYREIADKVIKYLIRDLKSLEGGFYSAEDADSEGIEGKFYLWSKQKIEKILSPEDASFLFRYYPMDRIGNFQGLNILNLISTDLRSLEKPGIKERLDGILKSLYEQRNKRVKPDKDDKILTAWNALTVTALSMAGRIFDNETYIGYAKATMHFIEKRITDDYGKLMARYRKGEARYPAYLDDYAYVTWAYVELYQATFDTRFLEKAFVKMEEIMDNFGDEEGSKGFYIYGRDGERLIARPKEIIDNVMPSGNAITLFLLIKLGKIGNRRDYLEKADSMLTYFAGKINEAPMVYTMMLTGKMLMDFGKQEIVMTGDLNDPLTQEMIKEINSHYLPLAFVLLNKSEQDFASINPVLKSFKRVDDKTTAYVCDVTGCKPPVNDLSGLKEILNKHD
ncbi:thioredoxin domain-containing protein [Eubacteriaceae bacterium ES3]|nr:thioredoxin domain-containing protein [Eubacteriaceae bacterium ES3]